jgi:hypothetical protein
MKKWNLVLAAAAGFLGGSLSHLAFPQAARAQEPRQTQIQPAPKVVEAQSFELTDQDGNVLGRFGPDTAQGSANIVLYGADHKVIWRARGGPLFRPLGER